MNKSISTLLMLLLISLLFSNVTYADNPAIKDYFSADPAAIEHNGKVYLYTGHDSAAVGGGGYVIPEWSIYSSTDMNNWEFEGSVSDDIFEWSQNDSAWASEVIERDGKFYWYTTVENSDSSAPGKAIGVAVSDDPVEGWTDAIGKPLVKSTDTENPDNMGSWSWDDIDPTVFIDDEGQAYLYWGNTHLYYAKLKDNMVELDGEIHKTEIQDMPGTFTEAPFIHQYGGKYYLSFAMNWPEDLAYAMSDSPEGPWVYKGKLMDTMTGTGTNHPAILDYKGEPYFIYHTAALPTGGDYRRSVSIENLEYNADGTIKKMVATASGISDLSYSIQSFDETDRYVRNLDGEIRVEPVEGDTYDSKWHKVVGLSDDGDGYVSFQSENNPGFYLVRDGNNVVLAKNDGTDSFKENATFKTVAGLADENAVSFQTYKDESLYLYMDYDYILRVSEVATDAEKADATFTVNEADVTGITLDKDSISLQDGSKTTLVASVTPEQALQKEVSFRSTNPDVVNVSDISYDFKSGETSVTVTAKSAGSAEIVASTTEGNYSASVTVNVEEYVSGPVVLKDVVVSSNNKTKEVSIEGYLQDRVGKNVTVRVTSPSGNIDYVDQTVTDDQGKFVFNYMINEAVAGKYDVVIGAADLEESYQTSFTYSSTKPGNGGDTPGDQDDQDDEDKTPGNQDDQGDGNQSDDGKDLPDTATNLFNYLLAGLVLVAIGVVTVLYARKKKLNNN
ncbi:family 43 glycosylhydrolase [Aquibacillus kalidii]|uniref:family 43 glycosylhydrolase n=1 Tax=Aquibacillus kalidii TaxID=2762597 RepID=UPI0016493939|nr:family 43 glycosylhydrolase [Aquibacillus kalidii]